MKSKVFKLGLVLCMLLGVMITGVHAVEADELVKFKDNFEDYTAEETTFTNAVAKAHNYFERVGTGTVTIDGDADNHYMSVTGQRPYIKLRNPGASYSLKFDIQWVGALTTHQVRLMTTNDSDIRLNLSKENYVSIRVNSSNVGRFLQPDGSWGVEDTAATREPGVWYQFEVIVNKAAKTITVTMQERDNESAKIISKPLTVDTMGDFMDVWFDPQGEGVLEPHLENAQNIDNIVLSRLPILADDFENYEAGAQFFDANGKGNEKLAEEHGYTEFIKGDTNTPVVTVMGTDATINPNNGQYLSITAKRPHIKLGNPGASYSLKFDIQWVGALTTNQVHLMTTTNGGDIRLNLSGSNYVSIQVDGNNVGRFLQPGGSWGTNQKSNLRTTGVWYQFEVIVNKAAKTITVTMQERDNESAKIISKPLTVDAMGDFMDVYFDPQGMSKNDTNAQYIDNIYFCTPNTYSITKNSVGNGDLLVSPTEAMKGETVTITATPGQKTYITKNVTVTAADDTNVDITDNKNGTWSFTMPGQPVTVSAVFTDVILEDDFKDYKDGDKFYVNGEQQNKFAKAHGYSKLSKNDGTTPEVTVMGESEEFNPGNGQYLSVTAQRPYIFLGEPGGSYSLKFDIQWVGADTTHHVHLMSTQNGGDIRLNLQKEGLVAIHADGDSVAFLQKDGSWGGTGTAKKHWDIGVWYQFEVIVNKEDNEITVTMQERGDDTTMISSVPYKLDVMGDFIDVYFDPQGVDVLESGSRNAQNIDNIVYKRQDTTKRAVTAEPKDAVFVDKDTAMAGETVTVTATPTDPGYFLSKIIVTGTESETIYYNEVPQNFFVMPAEAVTVTAVFEPILNIGLGVDLSETMGLMVIVSSNDPNSQLSDWYAYRDDSETGEQLSGDGEAILVYDGFAAKDMCEEITITFKNGDRTVTTTASIKDAAMAMYRDEVSTEAQKTMMVDLLNYGAEAQKYFATEDLLADALANVKLGEQTIDWSTVKLNATTDEADAAGKEGTYVAGTSLLLEDKTTLRLYFKADKVKANTIITINGIEKALERESDYYYYVDAEDLTMEQVWEDTIEYSFTAADGTVVSAKENVSDYASRVMAANSEETPVDEYNVTMALMKLAHTASDRFSDVEE